MNMSQISQMSQISNNSYQYPNIMNSNTNNFSKIKQNSAINNNMNLNYNPNVSSDARDNNNKNKTNNDIISRNNINKYEEKCVK